MRSQLLCTTIAATAAMRPFAALPSHSRRRAVPRNAAKSTAIKKREVPSQVWPIAAAAVMGISSSAALARGVAGEAAPAAIACWRVAGASALNLATRRARRGVAALDGRDATLAARSGLLLAAHFLLFFEALRRTSVLRSTILVGLCPLWVGLADRIRGRDVPDAFWLGCASAVAGTAVLAGDASGAAAIGDLLAAASGVLWAAYILAGRDARARVGASTWQAGVCLAATCVLAPAALLRGDALWGFSRRTSLLLAGFVALPQMVGHQGLAYVVKYLSARQVAALTLLEPVGATALAALFFGEIPTRVACFGAALVTAGVFAAL